MRTKERLAQALEAAGFPDTAERARRGLYDDYESPYALPKFELVKTLCSHGERGEAFAERVKAGEFNNTKEEAAAWMNSPEGKTALEKLTGR
jgi:hypothetical protein